MAALDASYSGHGMEGKGGGVPAWGAPRGGGEKGVGASGVARGRAAGAPTPTRAQARWR
jgi:hypothetical protein